MKTDNATEELAELERKAWELHQSILNDTDGNTPEHHAKVFDYRKLMEEIEELRKQI